MSGSDYLARLRGDVHGQVYIVALRYSADEKDLVQALVEVKLIGPFNTREVALRWANAAAILNTGQGKEVHYYLTSAFDSVDEEALR